jgi:DNA-binding CsgD family transcriptional regulator
MTVVLIGIYFLFLGMGLVTIYISYRLARRYRFRFLDYYLYNVIFSIAVVFINHVGKMFAHLVLGPQSWSIHFTADIIISYLALPAAIVSLYMMICWILEFLWGKVFRWFKWTFWLIQTLLILVNFTTAKIYFDTKELKSINLFSSAYEIILLLINLIAFLYLILKGKSLENKARRKLAINLGLIHLICVTAAVGLYIFIVRCIINNTLVFFSVIASLHISVEIIPLLYLRGFLGKHHAELGFSSTVHGIERFFKEFKITDREQSIIRLILKGKTNDEIGDELFISTKTVKNNISNIYQKTKVKNRIQLTNLVRGFDKEKITSI